MGAWRCVCGVCGVCGGVPSDRENTASYIRAPSQKKNYNKKTRSALGYNWTNKNRNKKTIGQRANLGMRNILGPTLGRPRFFYFLVSLQLKGCELEYIRTHEPAHRPIEYSDRSVGPAPFAMAGEYLAHTNGLKAEIRYFGGFWKNVWSRPG